MIIIWFLIIYFSYNICNFLYAIPAKCPNCLICFFPCVEEHITIRIICSIGVLGLGWTCILISYGFFRTYSEYLIIIFCIISIAGIVLYAYHDSYNKISKGKALSIIIESVNDVNNALSSFFPSRGDTDIKDLKNHYKENEKQEINENVTIVKTDKSGNQNKKQNNDKYESNEKIFFYVFFHCIAYLFSGIMTTTLWGRRCVNHLHNMVTFDKNKYVFWGKELDERCQILGQDIYNNRPFSEIIISLFDDHIANYIDENRLYDTFYNNNFILRIYNEKHFPASNLFAPYHFFISEDEEWNVKGCIKLCEERQNFGINKEVHIYIRLGEGEKRLIYDGVLNAWNKNVAKNKINLHVFNESELIARDFVNKHPMLMAPSVINNINHDSAKLKTDAKLNVLMLGFGWQGRQLLTKIVENSQFLVEGQDEEFCSPLSVDIIDKRIDAYDQYRKLREDACDKYHLKFEKQDIFSESFINWLEVGKNNNKLMQYDRIIISIGDDTLNLEAFTLMHKLQLIYGSKENQLIFVKQNKSLLENFNKNEIEKMKKGNDEINKFENGIFGTYSSIYTNEMILDEKIDTIAKYLHTIYKFMNCKMSIDEKVIKISKYLNDIPKNKKKKIKIDKRVKKNWQQETLYNKQSTRAQAEGVRNLLILLGFNISSTIQSDKCIDLLQERMSQNILVDVLAENEHLRWMSYMLMQGIKPWAIDEQTTVEEVKESDYKANQVKIHYRHADLVPFKDIPRVDELFNRLNGIVEPFNSPSPSQEYDYNVKLIPQILKVSGIKIEELRF